jgi:hypothetical protein
MVRALRWISLLATAVPLGATVAHVMELPNKLVLDGPLWLAVQQNLYRGWGPFIGPFEIVAIVTTWALAYLVRARHPAFALTFVAALCLSAMLLAFFLFNAPVNAAFAGWTAETLPADWTDYRQQWELGYAIGPSGLGGATEVRQLGGGARNREVAGRIERDHEGALLGFAFLVVAEIDMGEHKGRAAIAAIFPGLVTARHALLQAGGLADIEGHPAGTGPLGEDVVAGHVGPEVFESTDAINIRATAQVAEFNAGVHSATPIKSPGSSLPARCRVCA